MNPSLAANHPPPPPLALSIAFILLVAILYIALLGWLRRAGVSPIKVTLVRLILVLWLAGTALVAMSGMLLEFYSIPPRFAFVVVPAVLTAFATAFHPGFTSVLDRGSPTWLVGFQFFRVPMELILWRLAADKVIPVSMTFEGRNFDILVGLTAPVIAWLYGRRWLSAGPVIFWNVFGLVLLANIVTIAALSVPTPFQRYFEPPSNELIGYFPFVWLIGFVVPLALFGHLASIRQQLRILRAARAATVASESS